jgi:hypothetical protein
MKPCKLSKQQRRSRRARLRRITNREYRTDESGGGKDSHSRCRIQYRNCRGPPLQDRPRTGWLEGCCREHRHKLFRPSGVAGGIESAQGRKGLGN